VSNALAMSSDKTDATWFPAFHTVWICSTSIFRAVSVDLFVRLPIWLSGSSPSRSAKLLSQRAASVSMTFPIVLSRAIGLHAPRSE
jgi:hypothetical protein